jgi:hypothetical protein
MKKPSLLGAACTILTAITLSNSVHAATVNFVLDGTLILDYGSDDYNLDGADISWTFSYDTTTTANGPASTNPGIATYATYDALLASVSITNRPNSAADINDLALDTIGYLSTTNALSPYVDSLDTATGNFSGGGDIAGLYYGDFVFEFADENYFPGTSGAALPLLSGEDDSDIVNTLTPVIEDGFFTGYSMQTTAVPIPAAAWLFGSGLLGLVGIARRKKAS